MKSDPFAFLRGAAAIMAADLAAGPSTGLRVQACGDCHLANFRGYASPEGTPVFDVTDIDSAKIRHKIEKRRETAMRGAPNILVSSNERTAIGGSRKSRRWCAI